MVDKSFRTAATWDIYHNCTISNTTMFSYAWNYLPLFASDENNIPKMHNSVEENPMPDIDRARSLKDSRSYTSHSRRDGIKLPFNPFQVYNDECTKKLDACLDCLSDDSDADIDSTTASVRMNDSIERVAASVQKLIKEAQSSLQSSASPTKSSRRKLVSKQHSRKERSHKSVDQQTNKETLRFIQQSQGFLSAAMHQLERAIFNSVPSIDAAQSAVDGNASVYHHYHRCFDGSNVSQNASRTSMSDRRKGPKGRSKKIWLLLLITVIIIFTDVQLPKKLANNFRYPNVSLLAVSALLYYAYRQQQQQQQQFPMIKFLDKQLGFRLRLLSPRRLHSTAKKTAAAGCSGRSINSDKNKGQLLKQLLLFIYSLFLNLL